MLRLRFASHLIAVLLFLFLIVETNSQEYPLREYSVRDGLPQSQANSVFQDSRGFMWVLTRNGVSRFDGIEFVNYFRQDGLPSNRVSQVLEDSNRDIWALNAEGLSKYTGSGFLFHPPGKEFKEFDYFSFMTSSGSPSGLFLIAGSRKSQKTLLIHFDGSTYSDYASKYPSLDTINYSNIIYDKASSDLVISDKTGNIFSWKNGKLTRLKIDSAYEMSEDHGRILIRKNNSVLLYDSGKFIPVNFGKRPGKAEAIKILSDSGSRVDYFDGANFVSFRSPVYAMVPFVDNHGTLWIPSDRNLFRLLSTSFTTITDDLLKRSNLWAICMDKNQDLWLGSLEGNLFQYDGKSFRERNDYKKLFTETVAFYKGSRLLSNGELWISLNCGVLIWDGNKFSKLEGLPEYTQVCTIYEDPEDHYVYLGTQKGVFKTDGKSLICISQFEENSLGVIEGIVKDDSGFLWMSGHRSLIKFDGVNAEKVVDPVLPGAFTFTIEKDSSGGIWVSSDEGLFCKRKGEKYFRPGMPSGYNKPTNVVKVLDRSHLAAGRVGDICIIDLERYYNDEKDYYRIYDKTDGFLGGDCLDNGIIRYKENSFLILTSDGIVKYEPAKMRADIEAPYTRFTGIYYQNDSLSWDAVRESEFYTGPPQEIILKREQNRVRITFTGISTHNPEKVKYIHLLEGFERKWSLPSLEREVVFDNLEHGQYRFLLKAINADGVENSEPLELNFRIQPALMETKLFSIIFILFVLAITIVLTRLVIKRSHRIREEKQKVTTELIKMQISAVRKELDPHFTFNAISSIGYLIMQGRRHEAYSYLTRLSALLRTILYDGSSISRPLEEELDFVKNYCELQKLRFEDRFTYNIKISEHIETQREVPKMAIQIFVENSLKHGFGSDRKGGVIDITLKQVEQMMNIIIRDNGIGRAASVKMNTQGTGHGIKTVRRIFEIMNHYNEAKASVEITDLMNGDNPLGTEVILTIPDNYDFTTGK